MKALQIAVVVLVLSVSTLEALECNSCVFEKGECKETPERCEDPKDVCGTAISTYPHYSITKSCMTEQEVNLLSKTNHVTVSTCTFDRCN